MTVPFKTFSKNIAEFKAANNSQFELDVGLGGLKSIENSSFFGGVSFGVGGYAGTSSDAKDNPMYKYFNTNIDSSKLKTRGTINLLKATPGLLSTGLDGEGDGGEGTEDDTSQGSGSFKFFAKSGDDETGQDTQASSGYMGMTTGSIGGGHLGVDPDEDEDEDEGEDEGEDEEDKIPGMDTDALYFGGDGDYDTIKTIHLSALSHQKHAQARWQHLKQWVNSFGVDPNIQSKIADTKAVVGINAPAYVKHIKKQGKIKENLELGEAAHNNSSGRPVTAPAPVIPTGSSSPTVGIRYMSDIADFGTWEHPEKEDHIEDHPLVKYFMSNQDGANERIKGIVQNYMKITPGQETVAIDDAEKHKDGAGHKGIGRFGRIPNANTHALHFGNVGHADEKNELDDLYKKALAGQKAAQLRWQTLKGWMSSLTSDPVVAGKIADTNAVLGINTPAVMRSLEQNSKKNQR
jgi:hypothetical protein